MLGAPLYYHPINTITLGVTCLGMTMLSHGVILQRKEGSHNTAEYCFHKSPTTTTTTTNTNTTQKKKKGSKPMMVFIHGWPDNGDVWKSQIDHFSKTHTCVTITLPHYGRSDAPVLKRYPCGCSIDNLVDVSKNAVVEILKKTKEKQIILVCHDWGSWVGLQLQRRYPELIRKCVVFDVAWVEYDRTKSNMRQVLTLIKMGVAYQYYIMFCWALGLLLGKLGEFIGMRLLEPMVAGMNVPKSR